MPSEGEQRRDRVEAIARVERARRSVDSSGEPLSLGQIVEIVLGEGDWEGIEEWAEFALIDSPLISTEDLVDGIVSLRDWSTSNV
jgi:hypothetical protein